MPQRACGAASRKCTRFKVGSRVFAGSVPGVPEFKRLARCGTAREQRAPGSESLVRVILVQWVRGYIKQHAAHGKEGAAGASSYRAIYAVDLRKKDSSLFFFSFPPPTPVHHVA